MSIDKTRLRFSELIKKDGNELAAAKLGVSVTQVIFVSQGKRNPGLRLACAIEEVYKIPMGDWLDRPVARKI